MNKLATALLISVIATVLIGCSSGGSSSPEPQNVTGVFQGNFENGTGTQSGNATFNLSQAAGTNVVTGNATFTFEDGNTCLLPGTIEDGTVTGFSVTFTVSDVNYQLSIVDGGNTLSGTYVLTVDTDICSGPTGSGEINVSR